MSFRSGWEAVIIMAGGCFLSILTECRELPSSGSPGQISPIYFKYIYNIRACTVLCNTLILKFLQVVMLF